MILNSLVDATFSVVNFPFPVDKFKFSPIGKVANCPLFNEIIIQIQHEISDAIQVIVMTINADLQFSFSHNF